MLHLNEHSPIISKGARQTKIAIIGAGISGLGCAYALAPHYDVTLYEARSRLGGHSRTLMAGRNEQYPVDTGFMVFNDRNYPNLNALFDELDIPSVASNMSFGVSIDDGKFEYGLHEVNRMFADPINALRPSFWRMIKDILKFNKHGHIYKSDPNITLGQALSKMGLSETFKRNYLCPLAGAIWSTSPEDMMDFPAQTLVQFFENHGLMSTKGSPQWYTPEGGSKIYVERMAKFLRGHGATIFTDMPVLGVERSKPKTTVLTSAHPPATYDKVIFACHSDQALRLLAKPTKQEKSLLGALRYKKNTVILHDDPSQMPVRRACWSSWVYKGYSDNPNENSFTYWMNSLQHIPNSTPVFVTLNPKIPIRDEFIFNTTTLAHPQFDLPALKAKEELPSIQGLNNTWYCGAYARYGFHEDGLTSGLNVAHHLHEQSKSEHDLDKEEAFA
ncbi:MAG: FAD-dependent oxidoreductase [Robiginitomaculum sp.]|nr:FAD-dependent oxidoreductase [Robiginitomaculum sp.]